MNKTHADLERFLAKGQQRSYLEQAVFKMLSTIESNAPKTAVIKKFIRFIEQYQADIVAGRAHETILVGGKYEALHKVDKIDWEKMLEALDAYDADRDHMIMEQEDMEVDDSDEYTEDDDDEGGEQD